MEQLSLITDCWWECKMAVLVSFKVDSILTIQPNYSTLRHLSKRNEHINTHEHMLTAFLFTIVPNWKQPKCLSANLCFMISK